jgi:hypothetical protein
MSVKKVINIKIVDNFVILHNAVVDNFRYDKVSVDNFYPKSLCISDIFRIFNGAYI